MRGPTFAIALLIASAALAQAAGGAQMSDDAALRVLVREDILDAQYDPKPAFEEASAAIYWKPYYPKDSDGEKRARTAWYAAQLPGGFPKHGKVRVLYLPVCRYHFDSDRSEELADAARRAGDEEWLKMGFEKEGLATLDFTPLDRTRDLYRDVLAAPAIRTFNQQLLGRWKAGEDPQLHAIFEPYCGDTDREIPRPPPPPPPLEPFYLQVRPGNEVFIISEFRSDLCEVRTGSLYNLSCSGWRKVSANPVPVTGSRYRYVARRPGRPSVTGEFFVTSGNEYPDHPVRIAQP